MGARSDRPAPFKGPDGDGGCPITNPARILHVPLLALSLAAATAVVWQGAPATAQEARPQASSQLTWCNSNAVSAAPSVLWTRIKSATADHSDIPSSFWSDATYRDDSARIACYESTFNYHAINPAGYYGWFQMSKSNIVSESVTFSDYWYGSSTQHAGWYQCTAEERYIHARYGNPAAAWQHELDYGWY
jgi:hypothetical protein